ncbi:hypothetical protein GFM07_29280 [Rhizobium leguminosarum bv. viciae]|nr:hypothetical protein [Rhizobium leguminosarum bv. viciae]
MASMTIRNLADAIRARLRSIGGIELAIPPRQPIRDAPDFDAQRSRYHCHIGSRKDFTFIHGGLKPGPLSYNPAKHSHLMYHNLRYTSFHRKWWGNDGTLVFDDCRRRE